MGVYVAVCPIARQLNIPKFQPYFKIKRYLELHDVVVRSSNYELYADLSERMMTVIGRFVMTTTYTVLMNHFYVSLDFLK